MLAFTGDHIKFSEHDYCHMHVYITIAEISACNARLYSCFVLYKVLSVYE